jgi:hypothetical protein
MINLEKLVYDILTTPLRDNPPDPEACKECLYHPTNMGQTPLDGGHCYMYKRLPETLCMTFRRRSK